MVDKTRLFIKPDEMVDGIAGLSLGLEDKEQELDVVTKEVLLSFGSTLNCVRCGAKTDPHGSSAVAPGQIMPKRMWHLRQMHCVCGGLWTTIP
jgi:hypothetical protein